MNWTRLFRAGFLELLGLALLLAALAWILGFFGGMAWHLGGRFG